MEEHPIVFFDGVCNLCNAAVRFIIRRDAKEYFLFASLQGEYAKKALGEKPTVTHHLESLKLLENGIVYARSSAALRIARRLSGAWPLLFALYIIPAFIRDFFYNIIAANRYRIWGRTNECQIPDEEATSRFL